MKEEKVIIKFVKTHPEAKLPTKAYSELDNCWDLYCCEETTIPASTIVNGEFVLGTNLVPVGLQVAFTTPGFGFATKQKSGLAFKHFIMPVAGEMDSNYRGDFSVRLINLSNKPHTFEKHSKITQFKVEKIWKTDISFTDQVEEAGDARGENGFGSSGKK
jgi:dUTP pyrophosphatase